MEEGEDTQSFWNSALPSLKSCFLSNGIVADGCENAPLSALWVLVVAPPDMASKGSGMVKSIVGAVTA
ncbi:hypothetical protein D3C72_1991790 [compost metagenome]